MNVFNELIVSEASAEDQLIQWKHDTRGLFNCFKNFYEGKLLLITLSAN